MQIFSTLRQYLSRSSTQKHPRGFTLVELLISAFIMTAISSIVLANFGSFESTILLKNAAYDVATNIREAQIYSLSVVNISGGSDFRTPYGLYFSEGSPTYTFYRYTDTIPLSVPRYSGTMPTGDSATAIRAIPFGSSYELIKICVDGTDCSPGNIDIAFRRPDFDALFFPAGPASVSLYIRSSRDTSRVWIVEVQRLGQISVYGCTTNCNP